MRKDGSCVDVTLGQVEAGLDMPLDPGIRRYVLLLRSGGVETFESCQGGAGHPFPQPTIRFAGDTAAGFKAFGVAKDFGLPVYSLRLSYSMQDGMLVGPWWEMVFTTSDRRDELAG